MKHTRWPLGAVFSLVAASAVAQPVETIQVRTSGGPSHPGIVRFPPNGPETNVTVSFNLSFPNQAGSSEDEKAAALEKAQHALISLIRSECGRLLAAPGMSCELSQMNVNMNASVSNSTARGLQYTNAGATASYAMSPLSHTQGDPQK